MELGKPRLKCDGCKEKRRFLMLVDVSDDTAPRGFKMAHLCVFCVQKYGQIDYDEQKK